MVRYEKGDNLMGENNYEDLEVQKEIGKRIAQKRKEQGYTVNELGNLSSLGGSVILDYEKGNNGKINIADINKISNVLRIDPDWILGHKKKAEIGYNVNFLARAATIVDRFNKLNERDKYRLEDYLDVLEGNSYYRLQDAD